MGKAPFISPERHSVRIGATILKTIRAQDSRRVREKKAPFALPPRFQVFLSNSWFGLLNDRHSG